MMSGHLTHVGVSGGRLGRHFIVHQHRKRLPAHLPLVKLPSQVQIGASGEKVGLGHRRPPGLLLGHPAEARERDLLLEALAGFHEEEPEMGVGG